MSKNPFASWSQMDCDIHNSRVSGKPPVTYQPTSRAVESERMLHDQILAHCRAQGYLVCHSRMDAPSTIAVGFPDFVLFMPGQRVVFLECKKRGGKATTEQLAKLAHARKLGFVAEIVDNFEDALSAINKAHNIC